LHSVINFIILSIGISTITNGAVRVLTTPVLQNVQINKVTIKNNDSNLMTFIEHDYDFNVLFQHPAPLPDIPNYAATPGWKLPPPAPSLKISKVSNGKL